MSDPEGNSQFCFPKGHHDQDSRETKTNQFPEGPDIQCFVIFLDFHFNSNKRITGANKNSRLGTYNNTNLILNAAEGMICKVLSLHYLRLFPPLANVFLLGTSGIIKNSLLFSLRLRVCVVVFIHENENWQDLEVFFPPSVTLLSTML